MVERAFFQGLDAESAICAYCGYCRPVCPTHAEIGWESCSPRGRISVTRLLLQGERLSADQAGRLYQCTLCGQCTRVCSTGIDLRRFWLAARAEAVGRGLAPAGFAAARDNVAKTGNIYGYPNQERAGWVEYMEGAPPDLYQREGAEAVYFVGCSSSFSPRVQRIAECFARVLSAARVDFAVPGESERCCGFPLTVAGMPYRAREVIARNLEWFRASGASSVLFTCPACRIMWREEYAPRLPGVRMLHSTELLAELLAAGRLPLKALDRVVTYHDPCDLGRNGGVYDAPRQVLAAIPGVRLVEVHERRERGLCCGGGGDLEMADPNLGGRVAVRTVGKLVETGARTIVTACPQCVRTLSRGVAEAAPAAEVLDIVELLAQALDSDAVPD